MSFTLRVDGQAAAPQLGVVDDVVVDERRGVDELHDRRVQLGVFALVAAEARRHQQDCGAHALAAALLDVLPDLGDERDLRLQVTAKLALDPDQIVANWLEQPDEIGRRAIDGPVQGGLI